MEKRTLRKMDLIAALVLIAGSLVFLVQSIKLFLNPFGRKWELITEESIAEVWEKWYESPALMPFIVSILILVCAVIVLVHARKCGARFDFFTKEKIQALKQNYELKVFAIVVSTLAGYIYILIPLCRRFLDFFPVFNGFPFMIATMVYIFSNSYIFGKGKKHALRSAILVSVVASVIITLIFNKVALIPLP